MKKFLIPNIDSLDNGIRSCLEKSVKTVTYNEYGGKHDNKEK
jgi:hypothetical protein